MSIDWQSIPGWTCPRLEQLYREEAARILARPEPPFEIATVVELGVAYGRSLALMASLLWPTDRSAVFGYDLWQEHMGGQDGNLPPEVFAKMKAHGSPVEACFACLDEVGVAANGFMGGGRPIVNLRQCSSVDAAAWHEDGSVDFCFIDALHTYESVKTDIAAWLPKMRHGSGVLAGHDLNAHYPGIEQAVREAFGDDWEARRNYDGWGGVWIHRVGP
jgi:hypothetical protein